MPIQHDAMQCGIACLSIICRLFGKNISIKSIEKICYLSKEGLSFHVVTTTTIDHQRHPVKVVADVFLSCTSKRCT